MAWKLPCVSDKEGVCQHLSDKQSSEGDMADMCDWMNKALVPTTANPVLSSMNLAGSLRLFTALPLVVHPQFESATLRQRVQKGYELYHCGTEESFADTMRELHAEIVVFELARCFFTPYILDDRRKNCNSRKHKPEDQLCVKLHAKPQYFELLFTNGGYSVFRLRKIPLKEKPPSSPTAISKFLSTPEAWREYLANCTSTQEALCGARFLESAATWGDKMKRKDVAMTMRQLADKQFPNDGYVAYYLARYFDYDANNFARARPYYERAIKLHPNNPKMLHEYLMFLDMGVKDTKGVAKLLQDRRGGKQSHASMGVVPLLELKGASVGDLLCEAAISAKNTHGLEAFGAELWARSLAVGPLSDCIRNNWQLVYGQPNDYDAKHMPWEMVRLMATGALQHKVSSHNQPNIRFPGPVPFQMSPFGR